MTTNDKLERGKRYIRRIRSKGKQEYARAYWNFLMFNGIEPTRYHCSYMAAQAVRINLKEIQHS